MMPFSNCDIPYSVNQRICVLLTRVLWWWCDCYWCCRVQLPCSETTRMWNWINRISLRHWRV